jgi:hypothetical protein
MPGKVNPDVQNFKTTRRPLFAPVSAHNVWRACTEAEGALGVVEKLLSGSPGYAVGHGLAAGFLGATRTGRRGVRPRRRVCARQWRRGA